MADQRVGIEIVARDQASASIGKARVEMDKLAAEINKLKREAAAGADVSAMGIDWKQLIEVILPLVIAILQALAAKTDK